MFRFLDRHLALTGAGIVAVDIALLLLVLLFTPDEPTPVFGSDRLALAFVIFGILVAAIGVALFLLGISRGHLDCPLPPDSTRRRA